MLCWFLLYNEVDRYMYTYIPFLLNLPPPSRPSQRPKHRGLKNFSCQSGSGDPILGLVEKKAFSLEGLWTDAPETVVPNYF